LHDVSWLNIAACQHKMLPEGVAYFAASFRTVVELRIVAALPSAFSSSAPEKEDSLILPRRSQ
jgi:hypothetical protein